MMQRKFFIGLDPGSEGAIALLTEGSAVPTLIDLKGRVLCKMGQRSIFDTPGLVAQLSDLLSPDADIHVLIEAVDARPVSVGGDKKIVPSSDFQFGATTAAQIAALAIVCGKLTSKNFTPSQSWKRVLRITGCGKGASVLRAKELFPGISLPRHDLADAACLAWICREMNKATT
jgi:hypothetical protein